MRYSKWILLTEALVLALIAIISTKSLLTDDALELVVGLFAAYAIPRFIYSRQSYCNTFGMAVLVSVWAFISLLAICYVNKTTMCNGEALNPPHLWQDAQRYYNYALYLIGEKDIDTAHEPFPGLPLMIVLSWKLFGRGLIPPISINILLSISAIVLTGVITRRLLAGKTRQSDGWLASMAMALSSSLFFLLSHTVQLLKEPLMYFGVTLCGVALATIISGADEGRRWQWRIIGTFLAGMCVVAATRTTYAPIMLLGLAFIGFWHKANWRSTFFMLAVGTIIYLFMSQHFHSISIGRYNEFFDPKRSSLMSYQFIIGPTQSPYASMIGDYFRFPFWKKALYLPLTCAVQYVIPFPWFYGKTGLGHIVPRIAWTWYAIGGIVIFYYLFLSWRRDTNLQAWPVWAAFCFAVPAYVVAGSVSRYMLPFQLLMIPMAVYVLALLRQHKYRKTFYIFALVYIAAMAVTLISCYHVQAEYLQNLDEYYHNIAK